MELKKSISISEQIDTDYRKYAIYVIQSRGIPNFYDCLTPVQRLVLQNSPTNFKKTVGVIGEVFSTGLYHHGDSSMAQAISKLARPFACSEQILLGDGFFGSPVNPAPSAPRYTQVKISGKYKDIIEKYKDLNVPNEEGGYDWIHVDYPIGLSTHVVGIAVGYKSNILPRKPEDVVAYLNGAKGKKLKPYFRGFKGKITKLDSLRSAWLIEGDVESDVNTRTFKINSISPLQRYESFFVRLNNLLERKGLNYKMDNFSTDEVKISIKFRCTDQEFKDMSELIAKETKQIVTENLVLVKDGNVLEYECIEDYLEDFIVHRERTILKRYERDLVYLNNELDFLEAKLKFLIFMQESKRTIDEVNDFTGQYRKEISRRLESISLIKLTKEEIIKTKEEINLIKADIKNKNIDIKDQKNKVKLVEKENSLISKKTSRSSSLIGDSSDEYHNGIRIFDPEEEILEEVEQENELNVENE
jgi:DNA gyrase/topoisomerase IV subunit A